MQHLISFALSLMYVSGYFIVCWFRLLSRTAVKVCIVLAYCLRYFDTFIVHVS